MPENELEGPQEHPNRTSPGNGPPLLGAGHATAGAVVVLAAASLLTLVVASPQGLRTSADPGAPLVPYWVVLLPVAVGLVAARLLPPRVPALPPALLNRRGVQRALLVMVACALAFPALVELLGVSNSVLYHPLKVMVLLVVPALAAWWTRGSITHPWKRAGSASSWRWWAPALVVVVWALPAVVAPWQEVPEYTGVPVEFLIGAAVLTAITAGIGEEVFYRYLLQTRAEALLGRWGGIAMATVLFALMHVGSRQAMGLGEEAAAALVVQGSFGLFVAYLWARFRNLWLNVAAHILINGYPIVVVLTQR